MMTGDPQWIRNGLDCLQLQRGYRIARRRFGRCCRLPPYMWSNMVIPGMNWNTEKHDRANFSPPSVYRIGFALRPTLEDLGRWTTDVITAAMNGEDLFACGSPCRTAVAQWLDTGPTRYYRAGDRGSYDLFWWPQHMPGVLAKFEEAMESMNRDHAQFLRRVSDARNRQMSAARNNGHAHVGQVLRSKFFHDIEDFLTREARMREMTEPRERRRLLHFLTKYPPVHGPEPLMTPKRREIRVYNVGVLRRRIYRGLPDNYYTSSSGMSEPDSGQDDLMQQLDPGTLYGDAVPREDREGAEPYHLHAVVPRPARPEIDPARPD